MKLDLDIVEVESEAYVVETGACAAGSGDHSAEDAWRWHGGEGWAFAVGVALVVSGVTDVALWLEVGGSRTARQIEVVEGVVGRVAAEGLDLPYRAVAVAQDWIWGRAC